MKLNIKNLSVGDWVRHDFYELNMRMKRIDGDTERVMAECTSGSTCACHLDHYSAIPITPETFEKIGFKANEYTNKIYEHIEHNCLVQYFFVNHKLCIRNSNAIDVEIHYIHELQHALRLAGIEKEIEL